MTYSIRFEVSDDGEVSTHVTKTPTQENVWSEEELMYHILDVTAYKDEYQKAFK